MVDEDSLNFITRRRSTAEVLVLKYRLEEGEVSEKVTDRKTL